MNSSPLLRFVMAAGMYLLLMWGYTALPSAQLFAAFTALVMSLALFSWVRDAHLSELPRASTAATHVPGIADSQRAHQEDLSVEAANLRLDSLKDELTAQYAEFGRDQARLNSHGLGTWHRQHDVNNANGQGRGCNDQ